MRRRRRGYRTRSRGKVRRQKRKNKRYNSYRVTRGGIRV